MKCILEFGKKGGTYTNFKTIPTLKLGTTLAQALIWVFSEGRTLINLKVSRKQPRQTWENATYFVTLLIKE